jgi:hypothetical protein
MVSSTHTFPGFDQPWIFALNRGGQWTIDAEGRYAVFPGSDVTDLFEITHVAEQRSSRVIAAVDGDLWLLDRSGGGFSLLPTEGYGQRWASMLRVERLDLTLVMTLGQILRLSGNRLEPWDETAEVVGAGFAKETAFDLPGLRAVLFTTGSGDLRIRRDDGRWFTLGNLSRNGDVERIERLEQSPSGRTALLRMRGSKGPASRYLAVMASQDGTFRLLDAGQIGSAPGRARDKIL